MRLTTAVSGPNNGVHFNHRAVAPRRAIRKEGQWRAAFDPVVGDAIDAMGKCCRSREHAPGAAPCPRTGLPMSRLSAAGRTPAASGGTGGRAAALARSGLRAAAGLLVVFAALLTLPLQAQAQTVGTLVSNTGKTVHNLDLEVGVSGSNKWSNALGFTAGDNEEGYTLSSVQVHTRFMPRGSIPARAGKPGLHVPVTVTIKVYPRSCGETGYVYRWIRESMGLSPLVRGNLQVGCRPAYNPGSIPARAGKP